MDKRKLIRTLAERTQSSLSQTEQFVQQFCQLIAEELTNGNEIRLRNFGSWRVKTIKERMGRNPRNGEAVYIRERKKIVFNAGLELLDSVDCY